MAAALSMAGSVHASHSREDAAGFMVGRIRQFASPRGLHPVNCAIRDGEQRPESLEQKWHRFFDDPFLWWDNRAKDWRGPDFKNVSTGECLWIASCPEWVHLKLKNLSIPYESERGVRAQYKEGQRTDKEDVSVLLSALKECRSPTDFLKVKMVHQAAMQSSQISDIYMANSLVNSYARCGGMSEARKVFDRIPRRTLVTWNVLMFGYVENGNAEAALELFERMEQEPDARSFVAAVKACTSLALKEEAREVDGELLKVDSLNKGMSIHSQALDIGHDGNMFLANSLVDMYVKCGRMDKALDVFNKMESHSTVSWTALMCGYVDNGEAEAALKLFARMEQEPDARSFVAAVKACTYLALKEEAREADGKLVKVKSLKKGMSIHALALENGHGGYMFLASSLVDMYAKCGRMDKALVVFNKMEFHDRVSWTALMFGYVENGEAEAALELFARMEKEPDARTFLAAVKACTSLAVKEEAREVDGKLVKVESLNKGMSVHSQALDNGHVGSVFLANSLVDMYAKCGRMDKAFEVFNKMVSHDVVSWNALMFGYVENGDGELALKLFRHMKTEGCAPDAVSFVAALMACTSIAMKEDGKTIAGRIVKQASLQKGVVIHNEAVNGGYDSSNSVRNTLIDMFAKCGNVLEARKVFDATPNPDTASWNAMILGYADNGLGDLAVELFKRMEREGCTPNGVTFIAVLKACSTVGAFQIGKDIHATIRDQGLENEIEIANCLVDFYGKCGSMAEAQSVFDSLVKKNVVTWTALMAGYSRHGDTALVFQLFEQMRSKGVKPNGVTFLCVLTACSHAGLVEQGKEYFEAMGSEFQVKQEREHFHCMIDILGRDNKLKEALSMVEEMPYEADFVTWMTVLGASRKWKNFEVGRRAFDSLIKLDDKGSSAYILMENIYGSLNMWEEQHKIESMRLDARAWRVPGQSFCRDGS